MNSRQKEVLKTQYKEEQGVLRRLKREYKDAVNQIEEKIRTFQSDIQAKQDALALIVDQTQRLLLQSEIQSKIYQKQYQEALKKQIGAIFDNVNSKQYDSIRNYINDSYEGGFAGALYDLQGQGIPLVTPIDQTQVIQATVNDTKLKKPLYESLGYDINKLKQQVNSEISRGIATARSYTEIAQSISRRSGVTMNKAFRIARTEGHRVQNQAANDAIQRAKDVGADVVKQWDAAIDKRTRPSHARVDGEIRELDEPFSNGLMYPGDPNGSAGEVINCRCALLQRAKWALDENELETLKERAEYFGLDKTNNFADFKKKYIETIKNDPSGTLTNEEIESLKDYTGIYGTSINSYMYGNTNKITEYEENIIDNIHSILERTTIDESATYYRGSSLDIFGEAKKLVESDLRNAIGMTVTNKAFLSVSGSKRAAGMFTQTFKDKPIFYEILIPSGTNGIDIRKYSILDYEQEILLQDHTQLEILDVVETDDQIIFKARVKI